MRLAAILLAASLAAPVAGAADVLPFIENDFAKAAATAKAKNLPIFVEAWAPW